MMLLFPGDPLRPKRVDEHFIPQADAAAELGISFRTIDLDALERNNGDVILPFPPFGDPVVAIYRGWMLTPENYGKLQDLLENKKVFLRTSHIDYKQAHELPGWIETLSDFTPRTVELEDTSLSSIREGLFNLGAQSIFVRDYSKSLKHDREIAGYIPDANNLSAAAEVILKFEELRAEDLAGNILLREFEHFIGDELRTWWINGELRLITNHPDTPGINVILDQNSDWIPTGLSESLKELNLPFVTVDFCLSIDGAWRVIELGDGQVSDVPADVDFESFIKAIL